MPRLTRTARLYLVCAMLMLGAAAAWTARADEVDRDAAPPTRVRDLDYGDVLFHFLQDDYFAAIVRLESHRDFGRMQSHAAEAELLAGGLYLSLGLHTEATRIFDRLLAGPLAPSVRDRARFYLARIGHQRGYHEEALRNLGRIGAPLEGKLEPERRLLESNVLMALGRYDEAAARLGQWTDTTGWSHFARFNLGVALVRAGDTPRGRTYLEQVGTLDPRTEEQAALRDRANLALGFAVLQQHGGDEAVTALSRVRLDGPFTNRALLALGWAETNAGRHERALVPWLELQQRTLLDASVQESLLAVPYAYVRLASNGQASQHYRSAVDAYARETRRIDESIAAIRADGFLDALLDPVPREDNVDWFWQLESLPDAPQTRYLYPLLASHEFQEGLKNYRDLRLMQANLSRWRDALEAFDAMIDARDRATGVREPRREAALQALDLDALAKRHAALSTRLAAVEASRDVAGLATDAERTRWESLAGIDDRLTALPAGPAREELAERARLLRGVVVWQLDREFKYRLANARRDLADASAALAQARQQAAAIAA
ncbi:MAG TPA: tetratricopeptide repeat protein, partial [Steroidobacteraceae bacterium]|nr:tetratricopeptide repeat protein [Steroidobacteraceae bacterium]